MTHPGTEIFPPSALDLAGVDLLILDVDGVCRSSHPGPLALCSGDGVMTDGRLYYAFPARGDPSRSPAEGPSCEGRPLALPG